MKEKFAIEVFTGFAYSELIPMAKEAGFSGFFSGPHISMDREQVLQCRELSQKYDMYFETDHATLPGCESIWRREEEGDAYIDRLCLCVDNAAAAGVPLTIYHVQVDARMENDLDLGIRRLKRAVDYAVSKGVKVAIENTGTGCEPFLIETMRYFDAPEVGFCYDSGHEYAYTRDTDLLALFGDRLFCMHLHDNSGGGDEHLLPFDGGVPFDRIARHLARLNYQGWMTLELSYDPYREKYTKQAYLQEAYKRLTTIQEMVDSYR